MHVVFVYPAFENLGVEYLSASLELAGHRTSLVFDPALFDDAFFAVPALARALRDDRRIVDRILALEPDLVGFGVMTPTFPWAMRLARRLRALSDVPVVFGGIHPTTVPERVLSHPEVDYVVRGEGEQAIVELADALAAGRPVTSIDNLAFRDAVNGTVRVNPLRPLVQDLDTLPFPNTNLYLAEASCFERGYAIMTERGCSYSCSFCHHYNGKKLYGVSNALYVRRRSVANVMDELHQALAVFDPGMIRFEDETFTSDWPWIEEFCARYRDEIGLPFFCLGRPDTIHREMIQAMVGAGLKEMEIGVQSFDPEVRRRVAYRGESEEQVTRTLELCREADLALDVDVILNLPGQTEEMLISALHRLIAAPPAGVNAFFTSYYPGTAVLDIARERGLLDEATVEAILDGLTTQRPTQGGHAVRRSMAKLGVLMALVPHAPAPILRWLAERGRYRWLPYPGFTGALVFVALVGVVRGWFAPAHLEKIEKFEAVRTPDKYLTYVVRRLVPGFRRGRLRLDLRQPGSVTPRPERDARPALRPAAGLA